MPARRGKNPDSWTTDDYVDWALMLKGLEEIDIALSSYKELESINRALLHGRVNDYADGETRLWSAAQSFLLAVGMVGELFKFPAKPREAPKISPALAPKAERLARARRFSSAFGIGKGNPLRLSGLRNGFVHFLERYEAAIRTNHGGSLSDRGRIRPNPERYDEDRLLMRNIDPYSLEIHFLDESVNAHSVAHELKRLRVEFVDRIPTAKQHERQTRHGRLRVRNLELKYNDPPPIAMPEDWIASGTPDRGIKSPRELLESFVYAHNRMIRSHRSEELSMLFDTQGELCFQEGRYKLLDGRLDIMSFLEHNPPRRRLHLGPALMESDNEVIATYGRRMAPLGEQGVVRLRSRDGRISQLVLRRIPGKLGVATLTRREGGHVPRALRKVFPGTFRA